MAARAPKPVPKSGVGLSFLHNPSTSIGALREYNVKYNPSDLLQLHSQKPTSRPQKPNVYVWFDVDTSEWMVKTYTGLTKPFLDYELSPTRKKETEAVLSDPPPPACPTTTGYDYVL